METFGGISIDDLVYCPEEDYGAGIATQLLYAPADFFEKIKLPEDTEDFNELLSIDEDDIKFKETLDWSKIDILIEENELKSALEGGAQRKKTKSEVNFYILGFKKRVLAFIETLKNVPMIFGIKDSEGNVWLLGNLRNRAFIESAEGTTGKKYEDNSGLAVKVSAKSTIYCIMKRTYRVYSATITQAGAAAPVATQLENDLGLVEFIYQGIGTYLIRSNSFDEKTVVISHAFSKATIVEVVDGPSIVPGSSTDVFISITKSGNDFIMTSKRLSSLDARDGLIETPLFLEFRKYQN